METRDPRRFKGGGIRLGVDIGGTFTDLVAQERDGESWRVKVPTTPSNPAHGALESVKIFLRDYQVDPKRVRVVIHATTLSSNALLTGQLPKVALVTTKGFRDVLEIGRQNRPELYNLQVERLRPLIPRRYRFEVRERVSYQGRVLERLDTDGMRKIAGRILHLGMESAAVCFLHSYANPKHEMSASQILRQTAPRLLLSVSSELLPEFREYERTSTTVVNACLQPIISRYLSSFQKGLASLGIRAPLFVMQSNSGTLLSAQAAKEPARTIESGPVAGAVASRSYGTHVGAHEIISLDVGGTTSKAGVWTGNRFDVTDEYEVGGMIHGVRRLSGSGYPVRFPYVDLVEVGIGGGSIATVDSAGILHVGPESAGASPGPSGYGKGGEKPTLTDANLLLGRLNPLHLVGGNLKLNISLAKRAIDKHVARRMGISSGKSAEGILRVAIANMANAIRTATVEKGRDPRQMTLVAFGGAGPMHACEIAQQMEISDVLIPPWAGVFSSTGLLIAEPLHDFVKTTLSLAEKARASELNNEFRAMEKRGSRLLKQEGISSKNQVFDRLLDMRYQGQSFELSVPVPGGSMTNDTIEGATGQFHELHQKRYGYHDLENPVEIVNVRVYCRGVVIPKLPGQDMRSKELSGRSNRRAFIASGWVDSCPIYDRRDMRSGLAGKGPCIVEDYDSTIVLPRYASYVVDRKGSFRISVFH